jgi:hypothetical protein
MVSNPDMAREGSVVGEDHMIAHRAVMCDMGVGKEITMAADQCGSALIRGAMNGDEFAKGIVVSDPEMSRLFFVF